VKVNDAEGGVVDVDVDVDDSLASPLSSRHINTRTAAKRLTEAVERLDRDSTPDVPLDPPSITFYDGGRLIKACVPMPPPDVIGGGPRGRVHEWSKQSRLRMMRKLATVQQDAVPLFVTNTYPELDKPTPEEFKLHFKRFTSAFDRAFKVCRDTGAVGAFFWKVEFTKQSVPHLHLLVFGVPYVEFRAWFIKTWPRCIATDHPDAPMVAGRGVEMPRSSKKVSFYLGKYIWGDKGYQTAVSEDWGNVRWWGVWGRKRVPWALPNEEEASEDVVCRVIRCMRNKGSRINSRRYRVARGWIHRPWWQSKSRRRIHGRSRPSLQYLGDPEQWRRVMDYEQRPPPGKDERPFRHPWP